jgi:replication factor C subunit 2/4
MIKKRNKNVPWVDKYRPTKMKDIVEQEEVKKVLNNTLETGNMPHLIFHGPPGTGKTSTILAFAKQLFGPRKFQDRVIELNASDERGINVVRHKIITFAKLAISNKDERYPCPPYKLVILDEADAMTTEAQSALRKVMENLSAITRFCFICNYINQIIEPIGSRCMKFRFKSIINTSMTEKLKDISIKEELEISDEILKEMSRIAGGDVRKAIMFLQNIKYCKSNPLTMKDLYNIISYVPEEYVSKSINICIDKKNKDNINIIITNIQQIKADGYSVRDIIDQIKNIILKMNSFTDKQKAMVILHLAMTERKLIDGSDEFIQLLNIYMYIHGIKNNRIDYIIQNIC